MLKKLFKWSMIVLLAFAVAGILFWRYLPYQSVVAYKMRQELQAFGIQATSLNMEAIGANEAVLTDIELKSEAGGALKIKRLTAQYDIGEIRSGKLRKLNIKGLEGHLYKTAAGWQVGGLEQFHTASAPSQQGNMLHDSAAMRSTLPAQVEVAGGTLFVHAGSKVHTVPFTLSFDQSPVLTLKVHTEKLTVDAEPFAADTAPLTLQGDFNEKTRVWQGKLKTDSIDLHGSSLTLPPLQLAADFAVSETRFTADARSWSIDKSHRADFGFSFPMGRLQQGNLLVKKLEVPWAGGRISTEQVKVPLALNKPVNIRLRLDAVQLTSLVEQLENDKVKATGRISGVLPLIYHPNGELTLQKGVAEALEEGTIAIAPDLLPGDSDQLAFARSTLENFHYTTLKVGVSSPDGKKSELHLSLQGRNPQSTEPRPVNLNINLTGDILPLIQQSILPFNDLSKLIRTQDTL